MILFDRALNYELEGVDEFLKNDLGDSDKIFLLMRPETEFLIQISLENCIEINVLRHCC